MDIQAESVARAVKEPLHAAFPQSGLKALTPEVTENVLVKFVGAGAGPNLPEPYFLSLSNGMIGMFQSFRSLAAHDGSGHVPEVPTLLRPREYVDDDRRVGANRSATFIVRIDSLLA